MSKLNYSLKNRGGVLKDLIFTAFRRFIHVKNNQLKRFSWNFVLLENVYNSKLIKERSMQKILKNPVNHAVCKAVDQKEILNRVQNDSYGDLADCHPCEAAETNEILNRVQNDSYEDLAVCKSRRLNDTNGSQFKTSSRRAAFTLAETLITIGIIGVVAALTIPNLINNYKARQLQSQYLKAYSTISQALRLMVADGVPITADAYANYTFRKTFIQYLDGATMCPVKGDLNNPSCAILRNSSDSEAALHTYSYLNGNPIGDNINFRFGYGQILLKDGTLILIENFIDRGELWVSVDINGVNGKPNRIGYDVFTWLLNNTEKLTPSGATGTNYVYEGCNIKTSGLGCTYRAQSESDYFKWVVKNVKL
jgi:type II secretory pathway pseudopilin PulG